MSKFIEPILFGILTIPVVYVAISHGDGGDFVLSPANTKSAIVYGAIFGVAVSCLVYIPFQISDKQIVHLIGRVVGCVAEVIIFVKVSTVVGALAAAG